MTPLYSSGTKGPSWWPLIRTFLLDLFQKATNETHLLQKTTISHTATQSAGKYIFMRPLLLSLFKIGKKISKEEENIFHQ